MIGLILSFAAGVLFGVAVMCCCAAAGRADRDMEQSFKYETDIS